ncbi:hypothetical protein [Paenibacillus kandeliae]|uniref:hypothetical protein n=1 Tax=Paenibacillus kandeliae TaxID=3231269 RepID=UPI003459D379
MYKKIVTAICTIALSVSSGCSHTDTQVSEPSTTQAPSEASSSSAPASPTDSETSHRIPSADEIEWDQVQDPLLNNAIKDKLRQAIDAIVAQDSKAFHHAISPEMGSGLDDLLDRPTVFTHIDAAHMERGRVLVPVQATLQIEQETTAYVYTFYLEKGSDGVWDIVSID